MLTSYFLPHFQRFILAKAAEIAAIVAKYVGKACTTGIPLALGGKTELSKRQVKPDNEHYLNGGVGKTTATLAFRFASLKTDQNADEKDRRKTSAAQVARDAEKFLDKTFPALLNDGFAGQGRWTNIQSEGWTALTFEVQGNT